MVMIAVQSRSGSRSGSKGEREDQAAARRKNEEGEAPRDGAAQSLPAPCPLRGQGEVASSDGPIRTALIKQKRPTKEGEERGPDAADAACPGSTPRALATNRSARGNRQAVANGVLLKPTATQSRRGPGF